MSKLEGIRSIDELSLAHQRVLIRVDFNVALNQGEPPNQRIAAALPTIRRAISDGARVILASHLGRPLGQRRSELSLDRAGEQLAELLGQEVYLPDECIGDAARKVVSDLRGGQVCLLENLRFFPEEERNDESFARKLAALCDVYVNDAFGCSHRAHASIATLPRLVQERGMGYGLKAELEALSRIAGAAERPFVAILGGAMTADKLELIDALLLRCSAICFGGSLANTLLAARGVDMKESLFERELLALGRALLGRARDRNVELVLPEDSVVAEDAASAEGRVVGIGSLPDQHGAFDIGPRTLAAFAARLATAKTVFWDGALGLIENPAFSGGTLGVLRALADSAAFSVVRAQEAAVLAKTNPDLVAKLGFISSGGSASLQLIEGKKLPGIEALRGSRAS